jgi:hypothetical protein
MLHATVFVGAAGTKLAASESETMSFARFGYTPWFIYLLRVGDPAMLAAPAPGLMALLCGIAVAHRHELPSP